MERPSFWLSKRFFVAILVFLGQAVEYISYGTTNIAVIAMTSSSKTSVNNQTAAREPEFDWDSRTKGMILSASSFGSICAAFSGFLALKYGGSTMVAIGSLTSATAILLVPTAARYKVYLLCIVKVIDGIGSQIKYSSISELWSHWAPLKEQSRLMGIGFSGVYAGIVVAGSISGVIIQRFGWPVGFYFSGGTYFLWIILWFFTVTDDPSNDKFISQKELQYIKQNQNAIKPEKFTTIFKNMIKSKVILALCSIFFASGVGFTIIAICLPMFINDITDSDIAEVGILASIPNVITLISVPIVGYVADTLQDKGSMTMTQIHKLFVGIGCIGGSVLLFVTARYSSTLIVSMICLTIFKLLISFAILASYWISNYVAPKCAGVVSAFCNVFYYLGTLTTPTMVGFIVTTHDTLQWSTSFCAFGIILVLGGVLFMIYGSSEPQPWSYTVDDSTNCQQTAQNQNPNP